VGGQVSYSKIALACFRAGTTGNSKLEGQMLDESQVKLAIRMLRRRLEKATSGQQSQALITALAETLAEFETGRMPRRYEQRRPGAGGNADRG
jgi:hypothetical protein